MTKEKKCSKCGEVKGLECFYKDKNTCDGIRGQCKVCVIASAKNNYQENKERKKEYNRKHYQKNKEHLNERSRKYRLENKDYLKDHDRKYYHENKEGRREYARKYYQDNIEAVKEYRLENKDYLNERNRERKKENPDKTRAYAAKRRSRKHNATPEWLTEEQDNKIKLYYKIAKALEMMDGVKRHVDHIVPLKGSGVRGLHVPWNLQILTAEQNLSKNNSYSDWGDYVKV